MSRTLLLSLFLLCSALYGNSTVVTADGGAFSIVEVNDDSNVALGGSAPDGESDVYLRTTVEADALFTQPNLALSDALFLATTYQPAYHPIRAPPASFLFLV